MRGYTYSKIRKFCSWAAFIALLITLSGCGDVLPSAPTDTSDGDGSTVIDVPDQNGNGDSDSDDGGSDSDDGGSDSDDGGSDSDDGGSDGDNSGDAGDPDDGSGPDDSGDGSNSDDDGSETGSGDAGTSGPTDEEIIDQIIASLMVTASEEDPSILNLLAELPEGATLTWGSDSSAVTIAENILTGPGYTSDDSDLALSVSAAISVGDASRIATIDTAVAPQCTTTQSELCQAEAGSEVDPYKIYTVGQLLHVASNLSAHYSLRNSLDLSDSAHWNDAGTDTTLLEGFRPIGTNSNRFRGSFDGNGHSISNLRINRPNSKFIGLFGSIESSASVSNLSLFGLNYNGAVDVGGLAGLSYGTISNVLTQGSIVIGGMLGGELSGELGGGLVGTLHGTIEDSVAIVSITAAASVEPTHLGGLVGAASNMDGLPAATIRRSAATLNPTESIAGRAYIGGLIGLLSGGSITDAYSNVTVNGNNFVGGLAGQLLNSASVTNTYASGVVQTTGTSPFAYGGLIGANSAGTTVSSSYWDIEATTQSNSSSGDGRTSNQLRQCTPTSAADTACAGAPTYTGWSTEIWSFAGTNSYPSLR